MRLPKPNYIESFIRKEGTVEISSGENVAIYHLDHQEDDDILSEWAKHILHHYRSEDEIKKGATINCNGVRSEYIKDYIIKPTENKDVSGDFGEFVFSDFFEYIMSYEVPRYKKYNTYPSNPTQGIDIFGFRLSESGNEVFFMEIKSRLSSKNFVMLNNAIAESLARDDTKRALLLENARLFYATNNKDMESKIELLQSSDKPPKRNVVAGVITSSTECTTSDFVGVSIPNGKVCSVFAIYGTELWDLAKELYERACL